MTYFYVPVYCIVPVYLLLFALVYGLVNCAGQGNTKSPLVLLLLTVFMLLVF